MPAGSLWALGLRTPALPRSTDGSHCSLRTRHSPHSLLPVRPCSASRTTHAKRRLACYTPHVHADPATTTHGRRPTD